MKCARLGSRAVVCESTRPIVANVLSEGCPALQHEVRVSEFRVKHASHCSAMVSALEISLCGKA